MSKDQKKTITLPVETVDNWSRTLLYLKTTFDFWFEEKEWPLNLCYDGLTEISNQIYKELHK